MNNYVNELNLTLDKFNFEPEDLYSVSGRKNTLQGISFLSNDGNILSGFNYSLGMLKDDSNGEKYFDVKFIQKHNILPPYYHNKPTNLYYLVEKNFKKIENMGIEIFRARLSVLMPKMVIPTHQDSSSTNDYCLKIHIPIKTNSDAKFIFGKEKFFLKENKAYIVNVAKPHSFENMGAEPRYHIIMDCIVKNEKLPFYCDDYDKIIKFYEKWYHIVNDKGCTLEKFTQYHLLKDHQ